jgi:hypothetical protein
MPGLETAPAARSSKTADVAVAFSPTRNGKPLTCAHSGCRSDCERATPRRFSSRRSSLGKSDLASSRSSIGGRRLCRAHNWERTSDLAPVRTSDLARLPSDGDWTVRALSSTDWRSQKGWVPEWDCSRGFAGITTERGCRSGRWRGVTGCIGGRSGRRWSRRSRRLVSFGGAACAEAGRVSRADRFLADRRSGGAGQAVAHGPAGVGAAVW